MKVQVLLSTFNGRKYLKELLESLFSQNLPTNCSLEVLARDDGSNDGTLALLDDFAVKETRLKIIPGRNMGVVASFFELLNKSDPMADYYFFCDQDDIWLPTKIKRATEMLNKMRSKPALYFARLQYVNSKLRPIGQSSLPKNISFECSIVENLASGCSISFNRYLRKLTLETALPPKVCLMHDWWMYILANACGEVIYDSVPSVWYRQHNANVVGATDNFFKIYRLKWHRFWQRGAHAAHVSHQAECFFAAYEKQLNPQRRHVLKRFIDSKKSFWRRLYYAATLPTRRQSSLDNLIFRLLILMDRY